MAYQIASSKEFERTLKRLKKHAETKKQLFLKVQRISRDPHHSGHPMSGKYAGLWECHIQNNLLIYRINERRKIVELVSYIDHDML